MPATDMALRKSLSVGFLRANRLLDRENSTFMVFQPSGQVRSDSPKHPTVMSNSFFADKNGKLGKILA